MPKKKPAYLLHKPTGQARVRIDGRDIYLGAYGSPASRERYDDLVSDWFAQNGDVGSYLLEVDDLFLLFLEHAREHYRKDGRLTSEYHCLKSAFRPLIKLYGKARARDFGPRALKAVRQEMIDGGYTRESINSMINRVRRLFRWGVENEHVPVAVLQALCAVQGLQSGRTTARDGDPVEPVDEATVTETLKHLSPVVGAMVQLQLLTGARPGELIVLRPCDLTMGTDGVWTYRPEGHKTVHRGRERRIYSLLEKRLMRLCEIAHKRGKLPVSPDANRRDKGITNPRVGYELEDQPKKGCEHQKRYRRADEREDNLGGREQPTDELSRRGQSRAHNERDHQQERCSQHHGEGEESSTDNSENASAWLGTNSPDCVQRVLQFTKDARGSQEKDDRTDDGRQDAFAWLFGVRNQIPHRLRSIGAHQALHLTDDFTPRGFLTEQASRNGQNDHQEWRHREHAVKRQCCPQARGLVLQPLIDGSFEKRPNLGHD